MGLRIAIPKAKPHRSGFEAHQFVTQRFAAASSFGRNADHSRRSVKGGSLF